MAVHGGCRWDCVSWFSVPSSSSWDCWPQAIGSPRLPGDAAATFLSGLSHVIAGPAVSLEEAWLRARPVKVLIKFQVCLVTGQRGSKNRGWPGMGMGKLSGFPAGKDSLLSFGCESE